MCLGVCVGEGTQGVEITRREVQNTGMLGIIQKLTTPRNLQTSCKRRL